MTTPKPKGRPYRRAQPAQQPKASESTALEIAQASFSDYLAAKSQVISKAGGPAGVSPDAHAAYSLEVAHIACEVVQAQAAYQNCISLEAITMSLGVLAMHNIARHDMPDPVREDMAALLAALGARINGPILLHPDDQERVLRLTAWLVAQGGAP